MSRRGLVIGGAVGVVVLAVIAFSMLRSLDAQVARAIERIGSELTGTAVRVGRVDLDLSAGSGTVRDLRIANPEGFSAEPLLAIGELTLAIDVPSVGRSPLALSEVRLIAPEVRVEVDERARSNVGELLDHLEASGGDDGETGGDGDAALRLRIERFVFEDGRIFAVAPGEAERSLSLPGLRVAGLGGATGLPAAELGRQVLLRYLGHVAWVAARDATFRFLEDKAEELGEQVGEAAKGFLRALRGDSGSDPEAD